MPLHNHISDHAKIVLHRELEKFTVRDTAGSCVFVYRAGTTRSWTISEFVEHMRSIMPQEKWTIGNVGGYKSRVFGLSRRSPKVKPVEPVAPQTEQPPMSTAMVSTAVLALCQFRLGEILNKLDVLTAAVQAIAKDLKITLP